MVLGSGFYDYGFEFRMYQKDVSLSSMCLGLSTVQRHRLRTEKIHQ